MILISRYFRWTLESHLQSNSSEFGSINVAGHGRFAGVSGLKLGYNVHVNVGAYWVCDGGLSIGDGTHFGKNSTIYTRNHNHQGKAIPYDDTNIARPVTIRRNVWVGANVTILPGAEIGEGAIIGAGSVVFGRVPDFAIYGNSGLAQIGSRDVDHYNEKDKTEQYGGASGKLTPMPNKSML